jgi:hypothetical protein
MTRSMSWCERGIRESVDENGDQPLRMRYGLAREIGQRVVGSLIVHRSRRRSRPPNEQRETGSDLNSKRTRITDCGMARGGEPNEQYSSFYGLTRNADCRYQSGRRARGQIADHRRF